MKVRALRGVCIGPGRHIHPDAPDPKDREADIDAGTFSFLKNIGAVEEVVDPSAQPAATTVSVTAADDQVVKDEAAASERATIHKPYGKKEK